MKIVIALIALLGLSACAGSIPGVSQQGRAGVSDWSVDFDPETGNVDDVRIIDGKEKANIAFKVDLKSGVAEYSATDVKAFDGQKARAALEAEISDDIKEAFPGLIDGIVRALELGL